MTKVCSKCGVEKELIDFVFKKGCINNRENTCICCKKINDKKYYLKNKNKILSRVKRYSVDNKKKIKDYKSKYIKSEKGKLIRKKYDKENEKVILENKKKWLKNNPNKYKKYMERSKAYILKNKDKYRIYKNEYEKIRMKEDKDFKVKKNMSVLFRNTLRYYSKTKSYSFFKYTGIHYCDYVNHFEKSEYWNNYCKNNAVDIDHIIPVSAYDFNDMDEIKKCWNPLNLRLLPAKENRSKNNKIDVLLIKKHGIEHLLPKGLKI